VTIAPGTRLGAYEIVAVLGAGGMGQVYRARDSRLRRDVALKTLPTTDPERRQRFEREALAIAALNHPNIVTIYSVEEADGTAFLTMELVEGMSLTDAIPASGLPLDRLLSIAIPLADALSAAHAKGITHRDLKPANVMLAADGRVKVLDFGLAKTTMPSVADAATALVADHITGEGRIVGTVAYMSPEQAQGKPIDPRSDLFSLGVLLYEMATGARPFKGDGSVSTLAAILKETPKPIVDLRPDLPRDLGRIVRRALAKDPEQRYQTAKDLRNDLQTLKDDLTSGDLAVAAVSPLRAQPASSSTVTWIAVAIAVLAAAAAAYFALVRRSTPPPADTMAITRLTATGKASAVAISPDGKYVVHVVSDRGYSLWARQVATSSNVQIVAPGPQRFIGLTFSPDGNYVYFTRFAGPTDANLYRIPVLGGPPETVVRDVDSAVALAADGSRLAFLRGVPSRGEIRLLVAGAPGGDEPVVLARRPLSDAFPFYARLAWSPDGRSIAVPVGGDVLIGGGAGAMLEVVDVSTGKERAVTSRRWDTIAAVAWLSDATVLVSGTEAGRPNAQIWRVSIATGEARRVTNDLNTYADVSVAAGPKIVATVLGDASSTLSVSSAATPDQLMPVTSGNGRYDGQLGLAWTPDGRIVATSAAGGQTDLWIMDADGRNARQLTSDVDVESHPSVCPDGRSIVFVSRGARPGVWRLNVETGARSRLTNDASDSLPHCLAGDPSLVFTRLSTQPTIQTMSVDGGPVKSLGFGFSEAVSPDGRVIAACTRDRESRWRAGLLPAAGGPLGATFDIINVPIVLDWSPRDNALSFLESRRETQSLWNQPIAGGAPRLLLDLHGERIFSFAWSRDGRLAVAHGPMPTDVVVLSGIQ